MSRGVRIQYPGAIYHVTSRGNRRAPIVCDDDDRGQFWERIGETVVRYGWEMFAATLMSNHFHLFFRTPDPNLSCGMQYLLSGYARWWNRRHRTSGHVFQGRFRGHLIENETYFWVVSRYVHLNPVPVLVLHPGDWPWSTYAGYLDPTRRWNWVAYETLLEAWQGTFGGQEASDRYRNFVEGSDVANVDPFTGAIDGWILGSQQFAERIGQQVQPASRRRPAQPNRLTLDELQSAVAVHYGLSPADLAATGSRHPARAVLAYLARRHTDATLRELAALLGLRRADCVPYLIQRARQAQPQSILHASLEQIERRLQLTATV